MGIMHKNSMVILFLLMGLGIHAQETKLDTNTQSVKEQRAMGYPLSVLEELPIIKGCEALAENKIYLAKCMKDQFNFLFAPFMGGIEKETKANGISVYIEFTIEKDGTISDIQRLKTSEQSTDEFIRKAFIQFRRKILQEKLIVSPGRIYDRNVNTLYAVKFNKAFQR